MFCRYISTMDSRHNLFEFMKKSKGNNSSDIKYVQNNFNRYHSSKNITFTRIIFKK